MIKFLWCKIFFFERITKLIIFFSRINKIFYGRLKKYQKKVLKIHLHQTIVLLQSGLIVIHYRKYNLMETVENKIVRLFFIKM